MKDVVGIILDTVIAFVYGDLGRPQKSSARIACLQAEMNLGPPKHEA